MQATVIEYLIETIRRKELKVNLYMKICLVYNLTSGKEQYWINAFEKAGVNYKVVKLDKNDWMEQVLSESFDFVIALPNGQTSNQKQLFDERVYTMNKVLGLPIYPSLNELLVYENKRWLSYWLKAAKIPHPKTDVFYYYDEAKVFLESTNYPIVMKSNIGASGSGVHILKTKRKALNILNKTFNGRGLPRRVGPNFNKQGVCKKIISRLLDFNYLNTKFRHYKSIYDDLQKSQILIQEYIPHLYEWRCARLGESYFFHKKIAVSGKSSGTLKKAYEKPSNALMDFIKKVSENMGFTSVVFDVFENGVNNFCVNEIQTYFGQSTKHLMIIDGKPGRFINRTGYWKFEEGNFNTNNSCDLRLKHAIKLFEDGQLV